MSHLDAIREAFTASPDPIAFVAEARALLHELSPVASQPIDLVHWVPIEKVKPNDYNPNSVANTEMRLLYTSILHDGYTQPIVTVRDEARDEYVIVDGFHRYFVGKNNPDISARNHGMLPVVVIDKPVNDRMASTVRHNRARGKHSVDGMASMVFTMLDNGWDDAAICNELGMEAEELLRLKHITGFSKLFEDVEYKRSWVTRRQATEMRRYAAEQSDAKALKENPDMQAPMCKICGTAHWSRDGHAGGPAKAKAIAVAAVKAKPPVAPPEVTATPKGKRGAPRKAKPKSPRADYQREMMAKKRAKAK